MTRYDSERRQAAHGHVPEKRWNVPALVLVTCVSTFGLLAAIVHWVLSSRSLLVLAGFVLAGCTSQQLARLHDAASRAQDAVAVVKANGPTTVDALEQTVAAVASQTGPLHDLAVKAQAVIAAYRANQATILDVEIAVNALAGATAAATKPVGQ